MWSEFAYRIDPDHEIFHAILPVFVHVAGRSGYLHGPCVDLVAKELHPSYGKRPLGRPVSFGMPGSKARRNLPRLPMASRYLGKSTMTNVESCGT